MKTILKGLFIVVFSLGFTCSAYSIPSNTYSQFQQPYSISKTKPGGGPRMPIPEASTGTIGTLRLTNLGNT